MVTRLILLSLLTPLFLFAGEFVATVNSNQVNFGEGVVLNLALKDVSTREMPSLSDLKKSFFINSQQQSSNTMIMNGKISSSTSWKITLMPQREGELTIPSISINTSEGILSTDPIKINVVKPSPGSATSDKNDVTITTDLSKDAPYKNELVFYTVKLSSKLDLANIKMQKLAVDDAIVESSGEPKIYKKIVDGVGFNIIEIRYIITPLKAGSLKIPSIIIQGHIPTKKQNQKKSFDNDFEPFFMMLSERMEPFMLATEEQVLNVQQPVAGMSPWLPAKSLKIEEVWDDSQVLQVGEPIVRSFKIVAEGLMSNQLPSLSDQQVNDHDFKIYSDKPEMEDEVKDENLHSFRKEQYTLVPQQSGLITLPEISIAWWDVTKNEKVTTRIPSKVLRVLPAIEKSTNLQVADAEELPLISPSTSEGSIQRDPLLYALLIFLGILLCGALFWVITLQKQIAGLKEKPKEKIVGDSVHSIKKIKPPKKDKNEKLPDLNPT